MSRVRSLLVLAMACLLVVALAAAAHAQAAGAAAGPPRRGPGMMGARGASILGLLMSPQVQKELGLSDEEVAKVREIGKKLLTEMGDQFAALREIDDREKRRAKSTELTEQLDRSARKQLRGVLPREKWMRLFQIRIQIRGAVYALNNKRIATRLKLTDEQREKAAQIQKSTQKKTSDVLAELRKLSPEERREKGVGVFKRLRKVRDDANNEALALLTAEQKAAFEKMQGKKFELQMGRGRP